MEKRNTTKMVDILLVLIIGLILFAPDNVFASHSSFKHTRYMHLSDSVYNETACVDTSASTMNFTTARDFVINTLRYTNTSVDWHGLASNRIYFVMNNSSCGSLSSSALAGTRARVYVRDNTTQQCNGYTNSSCTTQGYAVSTQNGNTDYSYETIWLKTSHLTSGTSLAQHTINHEFGHMLGLTDGGGGNCSNDRVMHPPYYCTGNTQFHWPQSNDRSAVTTIANMITLPPPPQ